MKYLLIAFLLLGCSPKADLPEVGDKPVKCDIELTEPKLKTIFHTATPDTLESLYVAMEYSCYFGIISKKNEDMYLATVLTEVGSDGIGVRENLNYSCSALPSIFSYYKTNGGYNEDGRCNDHSANQTAIGSKAYGNRLGNGSVDSGDGYTFRGGGYAQTTGRHNYTVLVDAVNIKLGTDYYAEHLADNITRPYMASLAGMGYWAQVDAGSCETMNCVVDKWNYYTESRQERNSNYNWISSLK